MMGECIRFSEWQKPLPKTLWLFSFKTKMTYLKERSILKMRVFEEATRCKVKEKVERALTTIAQLMTG
jgi:hypothetical protein